MENFVLYEELGRGDHSIVYKGRRKGTINFVAIHCVEKCMRPEVTNTVRMTHGITHTNVVQFHEWYETSNHLWLVVELCTGGSLESIITQDNHLPESSVREFGVDLVTGLHYIHTLDILFCDLRPSKILLDGPGVLKYADFGLSKVDGEDLVELFEKFAEAGEAGAGDIDTEELRKKSIGSPTYMAPEVTKGREPTVHSDLWSLGCIFYQMFTGHPPFLAESLEDLVDKIQNDDFPPPRIKGTRFSAKPSPDFLSLLRGLLQKDPLRRLTWPGLVTHTFWEGRLKDLAKDFVSSQEFTQNSPDTTRSSIIEHRGGSVLGRVKTVDLGRSQDRPMSQLDVIEGSRPGSVIGDHMRPKTAPGEEGGHLFTLSTRPHTAAEVDSKVNSPARTVQSPLSTHPLLTAREGIDGVDVGISSATELIFHSSDFSITPIVDNPKIQKPASLKYDVKMLQVPPYSVEKILSLSEKDMVKHLKIIVDNIACPEKGPPSQKRVNLLNYAGSIAANSLIAGYLVRMGTLGVLARQVKETQHLDGRVKLARTLGLTAAHCTELDTSLNLSEVFTLLTEVIRENGKNARLRHGLLPALGEMLYLVASQEDMLGAPVEAWTVPAMTYTVITRCCGKGEDGVVNHQAAKIIENVAATSGQHCQKFVSTEVAQALWLIFKNVTLEAVRVTALSALCRITRHLPQVFQSVLDTVGLPTMLCSLSSGSTRVQQALITMFGALIGSANHLTRLLHNKDFLLKVMRLLESPSNIIRAKAFIVLYEVIHSSQEMLLASCQSRLVMYVERDCRRQAPAKGDNQEAWTYLTKCLELIVTHIVNVVPEICKDILTSLEAVHGRKHPSAYQGKQLKSALPQMSILLHLITSQIFRPRIVTEVFMVNLSELLAHVKSMELRETSIEGATGPAKVAEFINAVLSVLEGISQHPSLLVKHDQVVIETILPTVAELVGSQNADTRATALRLFSEMALVYLSRERYTNAEDQRYNINAEDQRYNINAEDQRYNISQLHTTISKHLFPQYEQILLDRDPLPSYGLKLLISLLEENPSFVKEFEHLGLVPVLFKILEDHQNNPFSNTMQSILGIINCLVGHRDTDMEELYSQGLLDQYVVIFYEVYGEWQSGEGEGKPVGPVLQLLLEMLTSLFKHVSDVVRKALQAKRTGGTSSTREAEQAEAMLLKNKSLTDLMGPLTHLLCHEDGEMQDLATKCLSLMVQLFGGENREALSAENMMCYSRALQTADSKKQKILLRIIKRLISTEMVHADSVKQNGEYLVQAVESLAHTASSHADIAVSTLAAEILKLTSE